MAVSGMLSARAASAPVLRTARMTLRPPRVSDHSAWAALRRGSADFLKPWEPAWGPHHLSLAAFKARVRWARQEIEGGRSVPWLAFRTGGDEEAMGKSPTGAPGALIGGVTLEHIRRGAAQSVSIGYWLGEAHTGQGYMTEALEGVLPYVFDDLGLSRIEAACLPENGASRRLLERLGFVEGRVAKALLQIDGEWRDHVIYERFRSDRLPG